jgi:hypothetical protein
MSKLAFLVTTHAINRLKLDAEIDYYQTLLGAEFQRLRMPNNPSQTVSPLLKRTSSQVHGSSSGSGSASQSVNLPACMHDRLARWLTSLQPVVQHVSQHDHERREPTGTAGCSPRRNCRVILPIGGQLSNCTVFKVDCVDGCCTCSLVMLLADHRIW